jgi:hypothetical protein
MLSGPSPILGQISKDDLPPFEPTECVVCKSMLSEDDTRDPGRSAVLFAVDEEGNPAKTFVHRECMGELASLTEPPVIKKKSMLKDMN